MTQQWPWHRFVDKAPAIWKQLAFVQDRGPRIIRSRYGQNAELEFSPDPELPTASETSIKSLMRYSGIATMSIALATQYQYVHQIIHQTINICKCKR